MCGMIILNHWDRHWKQKHQVYRASKRVQLKQGEVAKDPYWVYDQIIDGQYVKHKSPMNQVEIFEPVSGQFENFPNEYMRQYCFLREYGYKINRAEQRYAEFAFNQFDTAYTDHLEYLLKHEVIDKKQKQTLRRQFECMNYEDFKGSELLYFIELVKDDEDYEGLKKKYSASCQGPQH